MSTIAAFTLLDAGVERQKSCQDLSSYGVYSGRTCCGEVFWQMKLCFIKKGHLWKAPFEQE